MLDSDKGILISIEFDDAAGFATGAAADAPPVWTEDQNGKVIALAPAADGLSCQATPVGPGAANVQCTAMVGGVQFQGTLAVPVTTGATVSMKLSSAPLS